MTEPNIDVISLLDGTVLETHPPDRCAGSNCCIHNPSKWPLATAPLVWHGYYKRMYRRCPHGICHPDVDEIAYLARVTGDDGWGVHTCDGCCSGIQI